jgi:predicted CXXCH cytochrome family protein
MSAPSLDSPARTGRAARRAGLLAIALVAASIPTASRAKGGAFRDTAHGRKDTGVLRVPGLVRGACAHCHGSPRDRTGRKIDGRGHTQLFAVNDNELCARCHEAAAGSWLGTRPYGESAHATSPSVVWPGPSPRGRDSGDSGKCVNCHDPHGVKDASGVVPSMLVARGATLCLACHTGNPGPDVASAFAKTYRHPLVADPAPGTAAAGTGTARPVAVSARAGGAAAGTCAACHDPHAAARDVVRPRAPEGSRTLLGVARVRVSPAGRGSARVTSPVGRTDTTLVREYEVCFKCHAARSGVAATATDVAAALNPANASFHPVEAQGRNPRIDARAFAPGWSADRLVGCSDCHGSDDDDARGPHGSNHPHILKARYPAASGDQQVVETDLCFGCHAYRTYGDPSAAAAGSYSRFPGHRSHAAKGLSCWTCHAAHGSTNLPALLAQRSPGLVAYAQEAGGGSCTVSCHSIAPASVTYLATYPR